MQEHIFEQITHLVNLALSVEDVEEKNRLLERVKVLLELKEDK